MSNMNFTKYQALVQQVFLVTVLSDTLASYQQVAYWLWNDTRVSDDFRRANLHSVRHWTETKLRELQS